MNATEPIHPAEAELAEELAAIVRARVATLDEDKKNLSTPQEVFRRILNPKS